MKCPHCGKQINIKKVMAEVGAKGGRKSRRVLTPEQARAMQKKSVDARRKNRKG